MLLEIFVILGITRENVSRGDYSIWCLWVFNPQVPLSG